MNDTDIRRALTKFISSELLSPATMVSDDEMLLNDGVVDSLGMIRLVGFIEESYEIDIPPQHLTIENFKSINTISDYLARQLGRVD